MIRDIKKILIVEDNEDLVDLYKTAFQEEGYEVASAKDGLDGTVKAVQFQPDLVLLDIMMPDMNGYEFSNALKYNSSLDPIIVVNTNADLDKDRTKIEDAGVDHCIQKSDYTPFETVEAIGHYIKTGSWK